MKRSLFFLFFLLILAGAASGLQTEFRKDRAVSGVIPEKPVRMELKRDARGRYSWSIQGTDVSRIIRADIRLRSYVDRLEKREKAK
ncbi:MAG: hypothetical protein M0033_13935 [Nitrospiraceae bacterium]|nr:hypothetical protein [Nitrospiraceae bacterium]